MYSEKVQKLVDSGSKNLGEKQYEQAIEHLGEACGLHQEETGEMDADLFLLYGKALYESGVSSSDILGDKGLQSRDADDNAEEEDSSHFQFNDLAAEDANDGAQEEAEDESGSDDDENGVPQAEDEDEQHEDEEEGPEKSDLELAWDILEVARGLFEKKVETLEAKKSELTVPYLEDDKAESAHEYVQALQKLSQVFDLLGEVSLESEHFTQAASDLEKCLDIRLQLYSKDHSSLVGESHFKLSLALEFCLEDPQAKDKARDHIASAIKILENDSKKNPDKAKDNSEMIQSLKDRYDEIENGVEEAISQQKEQMLQGILGTSAGTELLGALTGMAASSASAAAPAAMPVNDLTSMVKKRKPKSDDKKTAKKPKQ